MAPAASGGQQCRQRRSLEWHPPGMCEDTTEPSLVPKSSKQGTMVKITFQPVSAQKPEKAREETDEEKVAVPQIDSSKVAQEKPSKPFPFLLCSLTLVPLLLISGVLLAVTCYKLSSKPQPTPEDSMFHCRVMFEDSLYNQLRGRHELEENVGIFLEDNYEHISVPVPRFGGCDPADIIHDFQRRLTAYYDISLEKCYITELNTTLVMPPRSLWELLINIQLGTYLPQTYIIHEDMVVTGRVRNIRALGPYIHRLCYGKETYRLKRQHHRRQRREAEECHSIRHFENTFVMETTICDRL
ncbi:integral membrane protein 2Cb isoform X1 [Synchiropus splendidus]|uniref:integral membrane protein 2Cb isoform X1 n=2 Tax=Synchiropus splendidus TaxID=270530 RepID=UPI00237D8459|nr:integral membrane protein 2Cb isoform X1 [Synchiropus splendidus]